MSGFLERAAEILDLPADAVAGVFHAEITGNREMLVENHRGIIEYTDTEIKINTDGKEITKLRYLQYDYVPNGQALVFNEYNNAIAPCKELVIGQKYTVTILDTENGSVSVTPNGELTFGTEVTITATPNQGYKVKEIK